MRRAHKSGSELFLIDLDDPHANSLAGRIKRGVFFVFSTIFITLFALVASLILSFAGPLLLVFLAQTLAEWTADPTAAKRIVRIIGALLFLPVAGFALMTAVVFLMSILGVLSALRPSLFVSKPFEKGVNAIWTGADWSAKVAFVVSVVLISLLSLASRIGLFG